MRLTNKDWQNPKNLMWIKLGSIHMRDEGYRTFLSEALRKLAYYEDLEEEFKKYIDIQQWISVNERLPKAEEKVIVTIKDDSADSPIYYTSVGWYYKGIWVVENDVSYQVTAWMPLPESYKAGEQDDYR